MTKVCVIGSIAMDLVTKTNRIPNEGEKRDGEVGGDQVRKKLPGSRQHHKSQRYKKLKRKMLRVER